MVLLKFCLRLIRANTTIPIRDKFQIVKDEGALTQKNKILPSTQNKEVPGTPYKPFVIVDSTCLPLTISTTRRH